MIDVILYSRRDCHLCHQAKSDLETLQDEVAHNLVVVDIDQQPQLLAKYSLEIPVVEIGPFQLKAPISLEQMRVALQSVNDKGELRIAEPVKPDSSSPTIARSDSNADRVAHWITKHYLAIFNLFVALYLGLSIMAPVLMNLGMGGLAGLIYRGYGFLCHQLPYRSVFLFGEQAVYPREVAGMEGLMTFAEATGLSEGNLPSEVFAARNFIGNEFVGYKIALCQRDLAIWGGILIFGLIFGLLKSKIPALPWYLWILIGLVPVAVDGLSQLISQPPLALIGYRESTPLLRAISGFLFGFTTAWFAYPQVDEAMRDTRDMMDYRRKKSALTDRNSS